MHWQRGYGYGSQKKSINQSQRVETWEWGGIFFFSRTNFRFDTTSSFWKVFDVGKFCGLVPASGSTENCFKVVLVLNKSNKKFYWHQHSKCWDNPQTWVDLKGNREKSKEGRRPYFDLCSGGITFGDFMEFLSIMSKGTTQEKILWSFDFFDIDRNGYIERQEMIKVWNKWKMLYRKRDIFFVFVIVQVLEAVYEMVVPGSNVSQSSEVYTQVVRYQYFLSFQSWIILPEETEILPFTLKSHLIPGWDPVHQDGRQSGRNCDQARVLKLLPQQPHSDRVDVCFALKLFSCTDLILLIIPHFIFHLFINDKLRSWTVLYWSWLEFEKFNERPVMLDIIYSQLSSPLDGQAIGEFLHRVIISQHQAVPESLVLQEAPVTQQAMKVGIILGQACLHLPVSLF